MEKLFSNRQDGKYNEYFNGLIAHYKHFNFVLDECDNSKNDTSIDQKLKIIADNIDGLQFIPSQMMTKITSDPKHASQIMDSFGDLLAKFQKVLSNIYLKAQTETQKQNFNQWSDVHYNNFVNPIINVLDKNPSCSDIDILAEHFESSDTNNNDATLSKNLLLILSAADFNEESDKYLPQIEKALMYSNGNVEFLLEKYSLNDPSIRSTVNKLYEAGSPNIKSAIDEILDYYLSNLPFNAYKVADILSVSDKSPISQKLTMNLNHFFKERYKLEGDNFAEMLNYGPYMKNEFRSTILKMDALEMTLPGSVKRLNSEFNIYEFGRYHEDILLNQLKEENEQKPYGLIIFPRSDHNGAFSSIGEKINSIYNETKDKHLLRIFEASSRVNLVKILSSCNERYGKDNKISYLLLGGHGNLEALSLGDHIASSNLTEYQKKINKISVEGPAAQRMKEFFVEKPSITLFSCETGGDNGLIESVSKAYNAEVVAPKVTTAVKDIHVSYDELGKPHFKVTWLDNDANSLYASGEKLEN